VTSLVEQGGIGFEIFGFSDELFKIVVVLVTVVGKGRDVMVLWIVISE
jgi:hypothetical protein